MSEKLWLWRDGAGRYLAFNDLFPTVPGSDDPATIGQPCGFAIFHPLTLAEAQAESNREFEVRQHAHRPVRSNDQDA